MDNATTHSQIHTKQQLRQWLAYEKKRYPSVSLLVYLLQANEVSAIWRHQVLLRKTEYHINAKHKYRALLFRLRLGRLQNRLGIHIPPNTFQKGLKIMHLGPILVNGKAKIGQNCSVHINTAIVAGGVDQNVPVLGNDIVIGVGATILGNTHIPDGVAIGANALVNKDVTEANIAVAGVPAKKISNNGKAQWSK